MSKSSSKMAPPKTLLILFLSILLLFTVSFATQNDDDLDDDIALFESQETKDVPSSQSNDNHEGHEDSGYDQEPYSPPNIDERDVVVLKKENFSEFIEKNKYVLVEFYAPWCGHCQALAPEYAEAATELKGEVALAKVDATQEGELAQEYGIEGLPTMFFFVDGVHGACEGQRTKDAIVTWVKKKTGPSIHNITTTEEAEHILTSESKIVLAFLDSLVGPESEELAAASRLEDDINFYQTSNPDVAKLFNIEPKAKRPALVLLKKEDEKLSYFDGQFFKLGITQFVSTNKLPLVIHFTRESSSLVFENPIKRQLFLFATSNDSEKIMPTFKEAAKDFKGKLIFVYIEMDNKDHGKSFSDYFGVSGDEPRVLGFTGFSDARKFFFDGEFTVSNIKSFAEDFLEDKLTPFYKSDPIPETNNGDVKIVVGKSFDEIVLDESKDVLLEIYAPWCWHCQALEPMYNKLGMYLRGIDSLVISKMDGTTNEHSRAKADGFPTFLFFPAGNKKSLDPIIVEIDRTVVEFYKFLKKHASFPFKLRKPTSTEQPKVVEATKSHESKSENVKDEL